MAPPYQSVGRCIYCRSTTYDPARPHLPLGEEHIIARGLGGDIELPEASCFACETAVNRVETACINFMYAPIRAHLGLRSRKAKKKADRVWTHIEDDQGITKKQAIPTAEHPPSMLTPRFVYPTILGGLEPSEAMVATGIEWARAPEFDERMQKIAGKMDVVPEIKTQAYHLMLAKIGHAYAKAERRDTFIPLLPDWIRGVTPYSAELCRFVGTDDERIEEPAGIRRHVLAVEDAVGAKGEKLVLVRVRLFAAMSSIVHLVVAGLRL